MKLVWNKLNTPAELHTLLETVGEEYPVTEGKENVTLCFEKTSAEDQLQVICKENVYLVTYGSVNLAARGIGYALSGQECSEKMFFKTFAVLVDCTRSAVMNVPHFKKWLLRMALLGYNMAMLYTKDAYQLPEENYFGYMRGAYTLEEMREVDAYARKVGVEMIASIQTLGHMEPILRWGAYSAVKDTDNVLLADKAETYALLEKMLKFWSDAFSSRRIHIGMDETHDLGRGRFMDLNGYEAPWQIFNRHLKKVCGICEKFRLKPILWSDMYFRYANKNLDYYAKTDRIPEEITKEIPADVQLSYWDYYHRDKETYTRKLSLQKMFNGTEPVMASGIWTWAKLWCDYEQTEATVAPCIDACRETGTREIIFTMWGDDGNYCEFDSAFAGMAWAADYAANHGKIEDSRISALFRAVCGCSYEAQRRAGDLEWNSPDPRGGKVPVKLHAGPVLWDDPLMGILWHEYEALRKDYWTDAIEHYQQLREDLEPYRDEAGAGLVNHAWLLCDVLLRKLELRRQLLASYERRDYDTLSVLIERNIPDLLDALDVLMDSFRYEWMRSYKSWGFEVVQIKVAGVAERLRETSRRIEELLDGTVDHIEELEIKPECRGDIWENRYRMIATGAWFI